MSPSKRERGSPVTSIPLTPGPLGRVLAKLLCRPSPLFFQALTEKGYLHGLEPHEEPHRLTYPCHFLKSTKPDDLGHFAHPVRCHRSHLTHMTTPHIHKDLQPVLEHRCCSQLRFTSDEAQQCLMQQVKEHLDPECRFSITYSPMHHPTGKNHFFTYAPYYWPPDTQDTVNPGAAAPWGK